MIAAAARYPANFNITTTLHHYHVTTVAVAANYINSSRSVESTQAPRGAELQPPNTVSQTGKKQQLSYRSPGFLTPLWYGAVREQAPSPFDDGKNRPKPPPCRNQTSCHFASSGVSRLVTSSAPRMLLGLRLLPLRGLRRPSLAANRKGEKKSHGEE